MSGLAASSAFDMGKPIAPAYDILKHLPHYGFDENRALAVHKKRVEEGASPKSGGPNRREYLTLSNVIGLTIGAIIVTPINKVVPTTAIYCSLQDDAGTRLDEFIGRSLHICASGLTEFNAGECSFPAARAILHSRFEFDTELLRVDWVMEAKDGSTAVRTFGPIKDRPSTFIGVRNISVLSGAVLFRLANGLYNKVWI